MASIVKKPILYYDNRSPPARSCLLLVNILQIDIELHTIDLFQGQQLTNTFKKINMCHTVPTLVDGDLILTDSHVILIHLCEKYQNGNFNLWPKEYEDRLNVLNILFFEASLFFRRDSDFMSNIVRYGYANVDMDYHRNQIYEVFDILESYLTKNKFIALPTLTIADFSVVSTLSTVDIIFKVEKSKWLHLYNWFQYMKSMPEYEINSEGLENLRTSLEIFGKCELNAISNKTEATDTC